MLLQNIFWGYFYECGIGVPKSNKQAKKWYELAAKHGDENAQKQLRVYIDR